MSVKGQILTERTTGNTYEYLETSADTNGAYFRVRKTIYSKGTLVPAHIHAKQDEAFMVESGFLTYELDGQTQSLAAGESIVLPMAIPHNHYNTQDVPLVVVQTYTPAYDTEYFFETFVGLLNDGKYKNGKAGLLQSFATLKYLDSPIFLASIPLGMQKVLVAILGPVARLFGYRAVYQKYSGVEK